MAKETPMRSHSEQIAEMLEKELNLKPTYIEIKPRACNDVPNFIRTLREIHKKTQGSTLQFR